MTFPKRKWSIVTYCFDDRVPISFYTEINWSNTIKKNLLTSIIKLYIPILVIRLIVKRNSRYFVHFWMVFFALQFFQCIFKTINYTLLNIKVMICVKIKFLNKLICPKKYLQIVKHSTRLFLSCSNEVFYPLTQLFIIPLEVQSLWVPPSRYLTFLTFLFCLILLFF